MNVLVKKRVCTDLLKGLAADQLEEGHVSQVRPKDALLQGAQDELAGLAGAVWVQAASLGPRGTLQRSACFQDVF